MCVAFSLLPFNWYVRMYSSSRCKHTHTLYLLLPPVWGTYAHGSVVQVTFTVVKTCSNNDLYFEVVSTSCLSPAGNRQ